MPPDHDNTREPYGSLWRDAYIPVAREFALTIVGASNVGAITDGPWTGWNCIGTSLAIGPDGDIIFQGSYGKDAETIVYLNLNLRSRPARGTDWERFWKKGADTAHEMKDANDNESSHT